MDDTVDFFESLGILTKERNGYLYPGSGQASSIADVLRLTAVKEGVKIACDTKALTVKKSMTDSQWRQKAGLMRQMP